MQTALPPAARYDRLISRFGIMFFQDPATAFANIFDWLVPGGRFAFTVWNRLDENPWLASVREIVASIVELPKSNPDDPGPFRYQDAEPLVTLLERSGFAEVNVTDWRGEVSIGGGLAVPDAARFALASFSSFGEALAQAGSDASQTALQRVEALFLTHEEEGEVRLGASVHIITGARPLPS
jgi:SAM-dependent methyltransferase